MQIRRRICRTSVAAFLALTTVASQADTFIWDPNNDGGGITGNGLWDLTTANWLGAPTRLWPNEAGVDADIAVFGGTAAGPYLVTLGAPIVANGLIFDTDTYTITDGGVSANTLTLSGTAPTVTVSPGLSATINASVAGTAGLTKGGLGTLTLGGVNTYGGVTTVTNGVLSFSASVNLGGAAAGNSIAVSNNAILRFTGATAETLGTTRALAVGSGGATIEHAGTGVLTLNGAITAATGATFTKSGSGTLLLTGASPGWNGNVVVDAGTLQVGNVAGTQFITGIGASVATRTITVNTGAMLDFLGRDATGNTPPAFIVNGGTVRNSAGFTRLGNLTLNGGTISVIQGNSATFQAMTFNGDVTVIGTTPSVITTTGGTFNGIHLEKAGGVTITVPDITGDAAADLSIATPLLNITSTSAANGFIKNGVGTLVLTGANTFTGTMTINEGNVTVNGVNAANPSVAFSAVAGGTPVLTTNVAMKVANITQNTAGNPGAINGTGSLALNGDRTFTINDVSSSAVDLVIGVPVTNGDTTARAVTKVGPGAVQFDGINTFTGNLNINEGTVIQNASQSAAGNLVMGSTAGVTPRLTINAGVIYRLGNNPSFNAQANGTIIDGTGSLGLFGDRAFNIFDNAAADDLILLAPLANGDATTRNWRKEQTGRMVMQGDNTFTGNTDIYRGTLVFDYSINNGSKAPDATGIVGMRGGALILSGNATLPTTEAITSFAISGGAGSVQLLPNNGRTLTFNLNGITRTIGQGLVDFRTADAALGIYQTTATNTLQGILGPYATFNGNRFATVSAGALAAVSSSVQSDRSQWQAAQNIVVNGPLTGTLTTPAVNSLIFDAPAVNVLSLANAGALTVRSGGVAITSNVGANNTTITGGALMAEFNSAAGGTAELVVMNKSAGTVTLDASIGANNAPLSTTEALTLGGTGLIDVTARNFYTGGTNMMGRVRASGGNAFSDFGTFTMSVGGDMTTAGGAVLDLNGVSEGIGSLAGGAFSSQGQSEIQLGIGGTLTINGIAGTTYQGLITGSGTVIKKGSATQIMTTNGQSFTGQWQVLGGLTDFTGNNPGLTGVTSVLLRGGSLLSEQNQGASVDKINNAAVIRLEGTTGNGLRVTSNQNATRTETADRLDLNAGSSIITMTNTAGGPTAAITVLTFANATDAFTRANGATLLVRTGIADMGGTSTALTNRITFASGIAGDLVGGVGGAGTTTIPILPFAVGGLASLTNAGDTFVTVGANGMRPLAIATEYATNFATAAATDNLSQNATATGLAGKTVNSLRVDNSAGNVDLTGTTGTPLTLASGALLVSAGANTNATTIGGFDSILAGANDANPDELVVHVTSSNATPTTAALTINSVIANNGPTAATSLTKSGGGTLTLGGANTYTGTTTINQGVLQFTAAANLGVDGPVRLAGGTLTWAGTNTTDISSKADSSARTVELLGPSSYVNPVGAGNILNVGNRFDIGTNNVTLAHAIGNNGVGGLTKVGTGTLTLGEAPTYTGPTFVRDGGMNFPTIAANTTSALYLMSDTNTSNVTSTVTSGLNTQSLIVGAVFSGTGNSTGTLTVNGGAVNIGDGSGDDFLLIGYRDNTATSSVAGTTRGTVNFQTATSVNINVARMILGQNPNSGANNIDGDLNLSNGTNTVTANQIIVGNSAGPGNTGATVQSTIALGTGSTTFNVDSFTVGGQKADAAVTLGTGGTFTLRGLSGGTSSANVFIGDNDAAGTGTVQSSTLTKLDLNAGTADVRVNLLVIGRHAGNGTGTGGGQGSLIFNAGTVQAQTIQLGMSDFRGTSTNHASTVGVITQNGGTLRFQDLSKGTGVGTYNWNGGTIGNISGMDLTNQNMTIGLLTAAAHTLNVDAGRTATFQTGAGFSGAGSLTKTGNGLLALNDASAFTGGTSVQAGLLQANNPTGSALGTGAINVAVSGTLGGTGSVSGAVTVGSGGTVAPGASGIESLGSGALTMNAGSTFALEINTSSTTNDLLASTGSLTLDLTTSPALALTDLGAGVPLVQGTALPFITYNGTWNNGLFSVGGQPIADDTGVFTFGANTFAIDYNFGGNNVALVAVPEPGTAALLLGGLASVVGMRRRKRS